MTSVDALPRPAADRKADHLRIAAGPDGVEAAKCLALGTVAVVMARPLLQAAQADRVDEALRVFLDQLRIATWAAGAPASAALTGSHLQRTAPP